jgi:hypothetical protein
MKIKTKKIGNNWTIVIEAEDNYGILIEVIEQAAKNYCFLDVPKNDTTAMDIITPKSVHEAYKDGLSTGAVIFARQLLELIKEGEEI